MWWLLVNIELNLNRIQVSTGGRVNTIKTDRPSRQQQHRSLSSDPTQFIQSSVSGNIPGFLCVSTVSVTESAILPTNAKFIDKKPGKDNFSAELLIDMTLLAIFGTYQVIESIFDSYRVIDQIAMNN